MRHIGGMILMLAVLACSGCVRPFRVDGPYSGRIIDAQTNQPLEGVVVDATWNRVYPNVAGSSSAYYDTRETVTDKNGVFSIPGMGLLIFSTIDKPIVTFFKAGYDGEGPTYWGSFDEENIQQFNGKITRDDGKLVIRLKKLSMEERRKRVIPFPDVPDNKAMKLFIMEYNKEMIGRDRPTSTLPVE
jgi:hypothetical protein